LYLVQTGIAIGIQHCAGLDVVLVYGLGEEAGAEEQKEQEAQGLFGHINAKLYLFIIIGR
jgi:hypothetical protein